MSLKGYQWLDDNGKVVMSFTFKDLTLDVWQDTTKEEYLKFIKYLKENGWVPTNTDAHFHYIKD